MDWFWEILFTGHHWFLPPEKGGVPAIFPMNSEVFDPEVEGS